MKNKKCIYTYKQVCLPKPYYTLLKIVFNNLLKTIFFSQINVKIILLCLLFFGSNKTQNKQLKPPTKTKIIKKIF